MGRTRHVADDEYMRQLKARALADMARYPKYNRPIENGCDAKTAMKVIRAVEAGLDPSASKKSSRRW